LAVFAFVRHVKRRRLTVREARRDAATGRFLSTAAPKPDELTIAEAAYRLRVGYTVVYRMLLQGELAARRAGRSWLITEASVQHVETVGRRIYRRARQVAST
jgi:excisionase family DNA binding protein